MVRAFIAVDASSPELGSYIMGIQKLLSNLPLRCTFVDPEATHITLKFLGEVPESRLTQIEGTLEKLDYKGFVLQIGRIGFIPDRRRPRVVYLGVGEGAMELSELARRIEEATTRIGIPREKRSFTPHLTIARIKNPWQAKDVPKTIAKTCSESEFPVKAKEVKLKKSVLTPKGPIYSDVYVKGLTG